MLDRFHHFINEHQLCQKGDRVVVACSGGLDSVVLLDLLIKAGYSVGVAHANYGLRGQESDDDEAFVSELCGNRGIGFQSRRFDVRGFAALNGQSIQMAARELRYTWINEILEKGEFQVAATGHQLNDNVETVLMRLIRGTGLEGLNGIPPRRGRIVRPLLFASRKEIEAFAASNKLSWREDSSNSEDKYQRNLLRNKVVPVLCELNPSLESTFSNTLQKFKAGNSLAELGLQAMRKEHLQERGDGWQLSRQFIERWPSSALLQIVLEDFGFSLHVCEEIVLQSNLQPGKKFYSDTHELVVDRATFIIHPRGGTWSDVLIEEGCVNSELGPWKLSLTVESSTAFSREPYVAAVDAGKITFPLAWRKWKAGDSFVPLGMNGRKKVSDFLTDLKLSRADKDQVTVITSQDEIVWVAGFRISDHFKLSPSSQKALRLQLEPRFTSG